MERCGQCDSGALQLLSVTSMSFGPKKAEPGHAWKGGGEAKTQNRRTSLRQLRQHRTHAKVPLPSAAPDFAAYNDCTRHLSRLEESHRVLSLHRHTSAGTLCRAAKKPCWTETPRTK